MPPFNDSLIVAIRERIDYEALFGEFTTLRGRGQERQAFCVFHENTDTPAMSVNVEDGLYCCHNPDCGARGDVFDFYKRVRSCTFPDAVRELARRVGLNPDNESTWGETHRAIAAHAVTPEVEAAALASYTPPVSAASGGGHRPEPEAPPRVIDEAIVQTFHERLLSTGPLMEYLETKRGLTRETLERFKLGHDGQRYYVPVRDEQGRCVNIRRYKPDATRGHDKMISWRTGFGEARLFPVDALTDARPVYLFEGEMDTLLARQHGLNALTTTGGAGTWRETWNPLFSGRDVVVCYDNDEAGRSGAHHIANELRHVASSIKVVTIPLAEPAGADFTDYIVGHGHGLDDFLSLVAQTPAFQPSSATRGNPIEREPVPLHLSKASEAAYYNVPVRINVMVSGKTTAPFIVPHEVRMECGMPGLKMCERCPVAKKAGRVNHRIDFENNDVLQFINTPDDKLARIIKQKVGVPTKCGYVRQEVIDALNVEEVQLIPEIERTEQDTPYVTRAAYYMGHGLHANKSYIMTGITVPEPKKQLATHLIHTATPSQSNIDAFRLTDDVVERLTIFRPSSPGVRGLWQHLSGVYDDLERHTRIYQRRDLMLTTDLIFHSLLSFAFQGDKLKRGWCEALIIGDSRTGKTTVVQRLVDYYGAGEFTTGENTSLAGLIGGLHQVGTSWALQWGRIPLNDRRLLVIDEAGNLPQEQIGRMSSMRSEGVAEVVKVHTEKTSARTRGIWITNPRGMRSLSSYSQGVLAVKEMIGAPEDVARFDIVATAATGDVPLSIVNAAREHEEPVTYTRDLCHQRVMWAWSRTSDQVTWAAGAEAKVLELATQHGERYRFATEIPLVEPNEQRIKIARLAVATAVMFFSTTDDGTALVVRPEHVEFAAQFLETLYAKPSLAFDEFAANMRRRYEISATGDVERILRAQPHAVRAMMEQEAFTQRDFAEILGIDDRVNLRDSLSKLREAGFLRMSLNNKYLKTPAAIRWLRTELSGNAPDHAGFEALMHQDMPAEPDF